MCSLSMSRDSHDPCAYRHIPIGAAVFCGYYLEGQGSYNQTLTVLVITTWLNLLKGFISGLYLRLWPGCNFPEPPSNACLNAFTLNQEAVGSGKFKLGFFKMNPDVLSDEL